MLAQVLTLGAGDPLAADWWRYRFIQFTFQHWIPAGAGLLAMGLASWLGLAWGGTPRERLVRLGFAVPALAYAAFVSAWYLAPSRLDLARSLPLHLCDLAVILGPATLIWRRRWMRGLLFYWGIGLSTQAFITPTVRVGWGDTEYYFFWASHVAIVGSAFYDFTAGGFRPRWSDFARSVAISMGWMMGVFALNLTIEGANYGYVGNVVPRNPTIIDKLGPWPGRVAILVAIVTAAFAAFTWLCRGLERVEGRWGFGPRRALVLVVLGLGLAMGTVGAVEVARGALRRPAPHDANKASTNVSGSKG